jgi:hypothetical protein
MDEVSVTTSSTSRTTTTIFDSTTPEVTATTEVETTKNQETSTTEKEATTTEIIATSSTTYSPSLVCPFCPEPNGNFEIPGNCTSFYNCTNGVATVEVILFF